jgi:hypothetical protein
MVGYLEFPSMAQVFGIERHRTNLKREKEEVEVAFGVTSLSTEKANRAQMLAYNRNQWSIENEVHLVRTTPGSSVPRCSSLATPTWPLPTRTEARHSQVSCNPLPAGEMLRGLLVRFCCGLSSCAPPVRI